MVRRCNVMSSFFDDVRSAAVLRCLPDAVVVLDSLGRLQWGNEAAERLFGVRISEMEGRSAFDFVHPDDLGVATLSLSSVQEKVVGTPVEIRVRAEQGWRLVEVVGANHLDYADVRGLLITMRDLTERRRWEVAHGDDRAFRSLVHNAASILLLLDRSGVIHSVSAAVTRLLGHDQEQLEGSLLENMVAEDERGALRSALWRSLDDPQWQSGRTTVEVAMLRGDGAPPVPFQLTIANLLDDPTVEGLVVSAHDISQLTAARDALEELARHDPLTGLPNRMSLQTQLAACIGDPSTAAVFLDLDGFKPINDTYGHATGDEVLRQLADRLRACVRRKDVVARYGGDEFVVIATINAPADVEHLTARLTQAVELPFDLPEGHITLSASVGLAYAVPGDTPRSLLSRADSAMYLAKHGSQRRSVPIY